MRAPCFGFEVGWCLTSAHYEGSNSANGSYRGDDNCYDADNVGTTASHGAGRAGGTSVTLSSSGPRWALGSGTAIGAIGTGRSLRT